MYDVYVKYPEVTGTATAAKMAAEAVNNGWLASRRQ